MKSGSADRLCNQVTLGYTSVQLVRSLALKTSASGDPNTKAGNLFQGSTIHMEKAAFLRFNRKRL